MIVIGLFALSFVAALVYGIIEFRRDLAKGINCVVGFMSMEEYREKYGDKYENI